MKKICVIIPVFNALKETKACIKSILKNFDFNCGEIIIADDHSSKKTEIFLKKICNKHSGKLTLYRNKENLGYIKNCNNAIKKTSAEIIVLLNSDCKIPENFTSKIIECFDSNPNIITASPIASNSANYFIPKVFPSKLINNILSSQKPMYPELNNSEGFCFCIRKSFIDKYGLFDEIYGQGYYEEVDFCLKVHKANKKCVLIDNLYVNHKRNCSFGSKRKKLMAKNIKIFYNKWGKAIYKNALNSTTIKDIINKKFGKFSIIPLIVLKINYIMTRPNRLTTLKNIFTTIPKHKKNTKVIYTCISGEYDFMPIIQTYYAKDWRYICFTNNKKLLKYKHIGLWEIKKMEFNKLDNTRNARWHKLHPDILFPDSDESIWIDANIDILTDKLFTIINSRNSDILIPSHNLRDCIYEELETVKQMNLDNYEILEKVKNYLIENNMPKNYGLNETNIVYRKHNTPKNKKIMEEWWNMIENYSKRDQLSLSYILWKNNISVNNLSIDNTRIDIENFNIYSHNLQNTIQGKILKLLFC